jgi:hypothetical protein
MICPWLGLAFASRVSSPLNGLFVHVSPSPVEPCRGKERLSVMRTLFLIAAPVIALPGPRGRSFDASRLPALTLGDSW